METAALVTGAILRTERPSCARCQAAAAEAEGAAPTRAPPAQGVASAAKIAMATSKMGCAPHVTTHYLHG